MSYPKSQNNVIAKEENGATKGAYGIGLCIIEFSMKIFTRKHAYVSTWLSAALDFRSELN